MSKPLKGSKLVKYSQKFWFGVFNPNFFGVWNRSKLHKDKIAQGDKISQSQIYTRAQNCTREENCTKTILHQGSSLHEFVLCTKVKKYKKIKTQKIINKTKKNKTIYRPRVRVRSNSDSKKIKLNSNKIKKKYIY